MEKRSHRQYDKNNKYITRKEKTMCTRFVYRGDDTITGFNFEIDLAVWDHKIIAGKDRFYIGVIPIMARTATEMSEPCCMFTETRRGPIRISKVA